MYLRNLYVYKRLCSIHWQPGACSAMTTESKNKTVCGERTHASNSTIFFDVDPYGGIPSNLIINLIVFCIFVIIFLVLHKKAYRLVNEIVSKDKGQKHLQSLRSESSGMAQDASYKENGEKGLYTQFIFYVFWSL